jgi:hypothetical protein
MDLELDPPQGLGPLRLGVGSADARTTLELLGEPRPFSRTGTGDGWTVARPSGLSLFVHLDAEGRVAEIEVGSSPGTADTVRLDGVSLFDEPADSLLELLGRRTTVLESDDESGYAFTAPELGLTLWRPVVPESADDPEGRYFESVLLS